MKQLLVIIISLLATRGSSSGVTSLKEPSEFKKIVTSDYELYIPSNDVKSILVLFGGFPEDAIAIQKEFKILDKALEQEIAVLFMNFNRKLWLSPEHKVVLSSILNRAFEDNELPADNIVIGGFSSGGNVSLLLANYLVQNNDSVQPNGVFNVDSPVDLLQLYRLAKKNIERNYSESSIQEGNMLVNIFENEFDLPKYGIGQYELCSPYTSETHNIDNIAALDGVKLRFYTEPDTEWWKSNKNIDPEDLNAHWISILAKELREKWKNTFIELITTENKGYRSNGMRHPHSWSIIDQDDLINWILSKE